MGRTVAGFLGNLDKKKEEKKATPEFQDGVDMTVLAKDMIYPAKDGIVNSNVLIIGSAGSGKTLSNGIPKILHTWNSSLVIPVVKKALIDQVMPVLKGRGYEVLVLDLVHPAKGKLGYDPCQYVKTEDEMLTLAGSIVEGTSKSMYGESDPYWSDCTRNIIATYIMLTKYKGKGSFSEVIQLNRSLKISSSGATKTNLDELVDVVIQQNPDSAIQQLWHSLEGNAPKTSGCIMSMVNSTLSPISGEYGKALFNRKKMLNIPNLGKKKTALFVVTNNTSEGCKKISSILYSDLFRELFADAENNGGTLKVPVHIILDDFATSAKIGSFADYISVFRAAGISVSILVQSLSQLNSMYGDSDAATIRNNCDSMVFLGSLDLDTCNTIGKMANLPVHEIIGMQIGQCVVGRRGMGVVMAERYPTLEDPVYRQYVAKEEVQDDEKSNK